MNKYSYHSSYQPSRPNPKWRAPQRPRLPKTKKGWLKPIFYKFLGLGLVSGALAVVFLLAAFAWYGRDLPDPSNLSKRSAEASAKIYDRTGEVVLYEIHGERKRTEIPFEQIPNHVKHATLVAEDRNFYSHPGFDIKGIVRAVLTNVFTSRSPGGSTITQQLVKNTIVGNEKTFSRKIREVLLAYRIEQNYNKDQILNMYLNAIPYGGSAYGIEAASDMYFKKSAKDLTLGEAAVLAALPQAPTMLSPYGNNKDRLIDRQRWIINNMADLDYISEDQKNAALNENINFVPFRDNITAPHFIFYIRQILSEKYGESFVETSGIKVITTLDANMQKIAEEEVLKRALINEREYGGKNAALVAIDPKNGQILAMVGSRDYFDDTVDGNVNVATRPRQPGSSFKPLVYAAAFAKGYTADTVLYDVKTVFKTDSADYVPLNFNLKEYGPVSLRTALQGSLNIPAVKLLYLVGVDNVLNLADQLGYTTLGQRNRFGLSLVLGGGEVTLLEHTAAFQAFARDGVYQPPVGILQVEDSKGKVLEKFKQNERQALPAEVAYQLTDVLSDNAARVYIFGEQNDLTLGDRPVAAKTGTTNDIRDGWTIGYTPSLVTGVWAGNNDNTPMSKSASGVAAPIWNAFMRRALANTPVEQFKKPSEQPKVGNQALYGMIPNETTVVIDKVSGKLATDLTPIEYREERKYKSLHSILHYINKDDPTGPAPSNPAADPNYQSWEEAVRNWASANGADLGLLPPTEYDDVHTIENKPQLNILQPTNNQTVRGTSVVVKSKISTKKPLKEVGYFLDENFKGFLTSAGDFTLDLTNESTGFHTLRVDVIDEVGNKTSQDILFNYIP